MSMLSISGARLPPDLTDICDAFLLPVALSVPDVTGQPIVYANPPFEYLTGASLTDVLGRNFSMFNGSLTDEQISQDASLAISQCQRDATCNISYRTDWTPFYHLVAFQPLNLPEHDVLVMSCHAAFAPFEQTEFSAESATELHQAWRDLRHFRKPETLSLNGQDLMRLEAISMRFDAVFTRAQNALIKHMSSNIVRSSQHFSPDRSSEVMPSPAPQPRHISPEPFNLGPLSKPRTRA